MQILVTGGAGFIGSALIRYLIQYTNHTVVNLDKLTYAGNLLNVATVKNSKRYTFEKADICDSELLSGIFERYRPDLVIHLAAESHVDRSIEGPADFIQTNIVGTYTLLEVSRRYWHQLTQSKRCQFRFHHVSTDEVFGELEHPEDNTDASNLLFHEETPYNPSSPYSASKASADHLVRAWRRTYGFPCVISNCSNNYGPYQNSEKLIPRTILNALQGKSLPVYGKGNQIRDWLYVDDHVKALYAVATRGKVGQTYNIGGDCEKQNIEVVLKVCDLLQEMVPRIGQASKSKCRIHGYKELIEFVSDRKGHDKRYAVDSRKIKEQLGWFPEETFESGLRKTLRWYLENTEWCRRMA